MLEVGLAVAGGGVCLGDLQCEQGSVLYLALEDNERRLQTRIGKTCGNRTAWPQGFAFATLSPRADAGGLQQIRKWIDSAPNPRLVVIDVLTAFRAAAKSRENPYSWDYESLKGLQEIAAETNVAIVVVHHLRKNDGGDDPIDKISGTLGLTGAADTILILDRKGGAFSLSGRGRDVEEFEVPIVFDKETCRWHLAPDDERPSVSEERSQILQLLLTAPDPMTPKEIAQGTGMQRNNVDQLLLQMIRAGEIQKTGRGRYIHPRTAPPTPATDKIDTKIRTSVVAQGYAPDSSAADLISHRSYLHAENDPAAPIDQLITTLANLSPLAGSAEAAPEQPIAPAPSLPPPPDASSIGNERWQMRISARSSS
jgi:hypothetical protein